MRNRYVQIGLAALLILLPIIGYLGYVWWSGLPSRISIATGPHDGLYQPLTENLAKQISDQLRVKVDPHKTSGSLENLRKLSDGEVEFALYQPDTLEILAAHDPKLLADQGWTESPDGKPRRDTNSVNFVANLYSQPAHLIVRRGLGIEQPSDFRGRKISLGLKSSGDHAMGLLLLGHFGLDPQRNNITVMNLDYEQVRNGFEDGSLDAVIITVGIQADIIQELFSSGKCELLSIPDVDALAMKYPALSPYTIPAGLYRTGPDAAEPGQDVRTVAYGAQLLTRSGVDAGLVREVTRIVMDENFLTGNGLKEVLEDPGFARKLPHFTMHPGAKSFYDPGFDMRQLESWEAVYSLVASAIIASFFGIRWVSNARSKSREHRLDQYLRRLLEIEKRQVALGIDRHGNDVEILQRLLDEVTHLRQDALGDFSAHEVNEDRAIDSFIHMCHALSNKINAKISRERLREDMSDLIQTLTERPAGRKRRGRRGKNSPK